MKFRITDRKSHVRVEALRKWHIVFLWWPTRTSATEIQWLCEAARRNTNARNFYTGWTKKDWREFNQSWEYGPLTNLLTQPENHHDATAAAQSFVGVNVGGNKLHVPVFGGSTPPFGNPPPNALVGNGVLSPQAGCTAIPSGLGGAPGSLSQNVQNQAGLANAGAASYGAGHQASP